jgi:hypothetical protein
MLRYSLCAIHLSALLFAAGTAMAETDSVQYHYASRTSGEAVATDNVSATSANAAATASCSDCGCTTGGCASCGDCGCASSCDCGCKSCCDCGCKSCCENFCKDCCCDCRPTWTVKAGALIMQRSAPQPNILIQDTVTGATVANARNYNFNWDGGVDISAIRRFGDNALEVRYFGIDGWRATQEFTTPGIWNFPTNPPLFGLGVADIESVYTSRLYNAEINLRHNVNDRIQLLAGFRWLELHENLNFNADFGGNQAVITENTDNHLYGGQLGADMRLWNRGGPFSIDGVFKAGVYGNSSDNTFGVNQAIGPAFGAGQAKGQVAFVGEIGLTAVYQWSDHIALRGGYQVLWVDGVSLASDQLPAIDVVNASGIDTTGDAFYHGAMMSVDFTW